jgi:hypothetical protein
MCRRGLCRKACGDGAAARRCCLEIAAEFFLNIADILATAPVSHGEPRKCRVLLEPMQTDFRL